MNERDRACGRLLLQRGLVTREVLLRAGEVLTQRRQTDPQAQLLPLLHERGLISREHASQLWRELAQSPSADPAPPVRPGPLPGTSQGRSWVSAEPPAPPAPPESRHPSRSVPRPQVSQHPSRSVPRPQVSQHPSRSVPRPQISPAPAANAGFFPTGSGGFGGSPPGGTFANGSAVGNFGNGSATGNPGSSSGAGMFPTGPAPAGPFGAPAAAPPGLFNSTPAVPTGLFRGGSASVPTGLFSGGGNAAAPAGMFGAGASVPTGLFRGQPQAPSGLFPATRGPGSGPFPGNPPPSAAVPPAPPRPGGFGSSPGFDPTGNLNAMDAPRPADILGFGARDEEAAPFGLVTQEAEQAPDDGFSISVDAFDANAPTLGPGHLPGLNGGAPAGFPGPAAPAPLDFQPVGAGFGPEPVAPKAPPVPTIEPPKIPPKPRPGSSSRAAKRAKSKRKGAVSQRGPRAVSQRRGAVSARMRAPASSSSSMGLIVGGVLLALVLLGGVAFFVFGGGRQPPVEGPEPVPTPAPTPTGEGVPEQAPRPNLTPGGGAPRVELFPTPPETPLSPADLDQRSDDVAEALVSRASDMVHEHQEYAEAIELLQRYPDWLRKGRGYADIQQRLAEYGEYLGFSQELEQALAAGRGSAELRAMVLRLEGHKLPDKLTRLACTKRFVKEARRALGDKAYDALAIKASGTKDVEDRGGIYDD